VNRRASQQGAGSLPRPLAEGMYSWLWHYMGMFRFTTVAEEDKIGAVVSAARITIDSRAMRKILSKEEEIVFCHETDAGAGATGVDFNVSVRVLFKET